MQRLDTLGWSCFEVAAQIPLILSRSVHSHACLEAAMFSTAKSGVFFPHPCFVKSCPPALRLANISRWHAVNHLSGILRPMVAKARERTSHSQGRGAERVRIRVRRKNPRTPLTHPTQTWRSVSMSC